MSGPFPFTLCDADAAAAESPYTFFVPARAERVAVAVGDLVKLGFEYEWETDEYDGERMWVEVVERLGLAYRGTLANEPAEQGLEYGLLVEFGIEHILDIQWADPAAHPDFEPHHEYWARCLVDQCVLDGGVPVEFIYREEPDMAAEDHQYPDSGWRIRGREGHPGTAPMDERELAYVALGAVLNRDDSFLYLLEEPVGAAFMRDFDEGDYRRCE